MYKNIEILDKKKFKSLKFDTVSPFEIGKTMGVLPLGFNEVIDMAKYAPVIIMGDDANLEFVTFTGISEDITLFNKEDIYIPMFIKTYPFLNVVLKDKKNGLKSVIGFDKSKSVGDKKEHTIFDKTGNLTPLSDEKIKMVQVLNRQRDISKKIVNELKKYDLLVEKDFRVTLNGKEKVIIEKFFIINREKLITLADDILALWAKKSWITLIDMHLKSLVNFQKVIAS